MSEFHYVRTMGVDGGVDACDGPAIGVDLESILAKGLPPVKVALEIIASMCEILDIADQDGEVHGDVNPKFVFLDDTGAVSIEGFGKAHKSSRAPEGEPEGTATDLYGLGYTAFRLLSPAKLAPPKDDPDGHDDTVVDAIVTMGFGDIPEEFHGDIQWFLAKLMAFEADDRPPAVDAWRTFIAFAEETDGTKVEAWAPEAIEGGGARRSAQEATAAPPPPSSEPGEDLGGPVKQKGPLAKGAIDFTTGGGKPASATAFWSKDALKGALSSEPTDEEPSEGGGGGGGPAFAGSAYKPQAAAATSFWSKDQLEAERGPKRGGGAPNRPPRAAPPGGPAKPPGVAPRPAPVTLGPQDDADVGQEAPAQPPPPGAAGRSLPPSHDAQPQIQPQVQGGYVAGAFPVAPPVEEGGGGGGGMIIAVVVVVLFLLVCLGGGGTAAAVYYFNSSGSTTTDIEEGEDEDKPEADEDEDKPSKDTGAAAEEPSPTPASTGPKPAPKPSSPKPAPSSPKPSPTPTSSPRPAPSTSPSPTRPAPSPTRPAPAPAPAPTAPASKATVTFNVGTRGTIGCSDGQSLAVDGSKTAEFEGYQLPVSCMITVDGGGRWAGLISTSGTIRCSGGGSSFNCTGP